MKKNSPEYIYEQYTNANGYFNNLGLKREIERAINFEEGRQWSTDPAIEEYPKLTLNIIKQIGKVRKSGIMQNEYGFLVNTNDFASIRKIQDFLKYLSNRANLKRLDLKALEDDYKKGTAIGYFYWDEEKRGFMQRSGGQMRYEMVDIRNFRVANPYIENIQDQEWIIMVKREKKNAIISKFPHIKLEDLATEGNLGTGDTEKIVPTMNEEEEIINLYTKFFRNKDGEVIYTITTKTHVIKPPTAINPYFIGNKEEMADTSSLFDNLTEKKIMELKKKDKRSKATWNLYPFVKLCLNKRDNNFYGIPIINEYIETQKSINNHFSIYDKALQDNVRGGWVYRKGVLDAEEITTESGQMVGLDLMPNEDISKALGRLPIANIPSDSSRYSEGLLSIQKQIAGVSNVQLGHADYSGQSAKQTQMLLQRAQENASDNATEFNEYKKEQAYIMFLFAKFYYDNEEFVIIKHGERSDDVIEYLGNEAFNGEDFVNQEIVVDIKVGPAASFSEYNNIEILGLMVQSGQLPFEAYVTMLPDGYISNKEELIEVASNNSKREIDALKQEIEQQAKVLEQFYNTYKKLEKDRDNIDNVIRENQRLKEEMAELVATSIKQTAETQENYRTLLEDTQQLLRQYQQTHGGKSATGSRSAFDFEEIE